jgi:hypothetical protein
MTFSESMTFSEGGLHCTSLKTVGKIEGVIMCISRDEDDIDAENQWNEWMLDEEKQEILANLAMNPDYLDSKYDSLPGHLREYLGGEESMTILADYDGAVNFIDIFPEDYDARLEFPFIEMVPDTLVRIFEKHRELIVNSKLVRLKDPTLRGGYRG